MTLLKQGMIAFLIAFVAVWIGTKYFLRGDLQNAECVIR